MKKEILEKVKDCKALQGMRVDDVLKTERFMENLAAYWNAQRKDREAIKSSYAAMHKVGIPKGYKLPAHPIDKLMALSTTEIAGEYRLILMGESRRPAAERKYIVQLCKQAYTLTIAQYIVEEYPELKDELIPKSKTN